jgi:signal transduction histidine kinase
LIDDSEAVLRFERTLGDAWYEGDSKAIQARLAKSFPTDESPPTSAGSHVFQTGETYVIRDVRDNRAYYDGTFAQTTRMIIAPIRVQDEIIGVLDIRSVGTEFFPKYADYKAAVLGQQLGLYHYLSATVGELHKTEIESSARAKQLEKVKNEQIQTFQDLTHQFRTPIRQANAWLTEAIENITLDDHLKPLLWRVRGLSSKAQRVNANLELFADLARGARLKLENSHIRMSELLRLLKEGNQDIQNLMNDHEHRNIRFYVDESSFTHPKKRPRFIQSLYADRSLLEQALGDLLENAAKYSYPDTEVRIFGGWTSAGRFHISVENEGIPITLAESKKCSERGWQGELAKETRQGGKGIGLWIVDRIMKSHDGELQVLPTEGGLTSIRMIFPEERIL